MKGVGKRTSLVTDRVVVDCVRGGWGNVRRKALWCVSVGFVVPSCLVFAASREVCEHNLAILVPTFLSKMNKVESLYQNR